MLVNSVSEITLRLMALQSTTQTGWGREINDTTTLSKKKTHRGVKQCRLWLTFIAAKMNVIDQTFAAKMLVIDRQIFNKCWSLTDIFSRNCWSLTDILQEMLVNGIHWKNPTVYGVTGHRAKRENAKSMKQPHFARKRFLDVWNSADYGCPFISAKMNVIVQHLQQKCWSLTWQTFFEKCWSTASAKLANGLWRYRAPPDRWQRKINETTTLSKKKTHRGVKQCRLGLSFISAKMNVIDQHIGHWQTIFNKCWSLTDIFQEMLVIDRHFSRNVGQPLQRKYPTAYGATGHRATAENAKSTKQPHFPRQRFIEVWNSADYGFPWFLRKWTSLTNICS